MNLNCDALAQFWMTECTKSSLTQRSFDTYYPIRSCDQHHGSYLVYGQADGVDESNLHGWQLIFLVSIHHVNWFDVQFIFLQVTLFEEFIRYQVGHLSWQNFIRCPSQGGASAGIVNKMGIHTFCWTFQGLVMAETSQAVIIMLLKIDTRVRYEPKKLSWLAQGFVFTWGDLGLFPQSTQTAQLQPCWRILLDTWGLIRNRMNRNSVSVTAV